ncbi:MAG TPA: EscU/YscU/HrcU family type III secretion system export apparatus switch protein [Candidatus Elarobacter sp.]|jgi:flagellar biosynthetic protein FlhB|nr:EscU/YscU/HrcU family type III secretion system export apparatus switch protein [Candidatus Elarobacter sp.]
MSAGDKRYESTPSRRERAKREGNVARSSEVNGVAAFSAATLAATAAVPLVAAGVVSALKGAASDVASAVANARAPTGALLHAFVVVALAALMPAAAAACAGSFGAYAQGGGLHVAGLRFEGKRLDPITGLKRMFGGETIVGVARAALALIATLVALLPLGRDVVAAGIVLGSPGAAASLVAFAALRACGAALCVGTAFAVVDYALARRRWMRGLKMSFDELKRDTKENEGDPQARSRRKSAHRAIVRGAVGRTREASFVVVNPEHVAVALRYAPPEVPVPEILVRALDEAALRVKAIARENRIPVVEDVGLARLLYAQGRNGRAIPPDAYVAVAQIVAALAREGLLE